MEQNMEPIRVSKGSMIKSNDKIVIKWSENKKEQRKKFHFCKYKRTEEETLKLAEEFFKTIQEKHKIWKDYNKAKQDEKRKESRRKYNKEYYKDYKKAYYLKKRGDIFFTDENGITTKVKYLKDIYS